jgi:hypothetical protein
MICGETLLLLKMKTTWSKISGKDMVISAPETYKIAKLNPAVYKYKHTSTQNGEPTNLQKICE